MTDAKPLRLCGSAELAEQLGWISQRVTVNLKRGNLPEPVVRLKCGPVWTGEQVDEIVRQVAAKGGARSVSVQAR